MEWAAMPWSWLLSPHTLPYFFLITAPCQFERQPTITLGHMCEQRARARCPASVLRAVRTVPAAAAPPPLPPFPFEQAWQAGRTESRPCCP